MTRRVFISYQHRDQLKAKGFNLMRYNQNLNLNFFGRHMLDPVKSADPDYISRKIRAQIKNSSVTVVLIGRDTAESVWVDREISWSVEKTPPSGLLGIRLSPEATVPDQLTERGVEILDWNKPDDIHEFEGAIERAAKMAGAPRLMSLNSVSTCSR